MVRTRATPVRERHLLLSSLMLVILLVALAPGVARSDEATARAKAHNAAAVKFFNLGDFDKAAIEYKKAYDARPMPVFLYNLAQCHKRMEGEKNLKKALFYFEAYLSNAKDAPRAEIEEEIAGVKVKLKALQEAAQQQKDKQGKREQKGVGLAPKPQLNETSDPQSASSPALDLSVSKGPGDDLSVKESPSRPFYKTWWFWTAVGAVVVASAATATAIALQPSDPTPVSGSLPPNGPIELK